MEFKNTPLKHVRKSVNQIQVNGVIGGKEELKKKQTLYADHSDIGNGENKSLKGIIIHVLLAVLKVVI